MAATSTEAGSRGYARLRRGAVLRPPWSDEASIRAACTSCGACLTACPEAILIEGPARTPVVSFAETGCTFCGDCAASCPEDVFRPVCDTPWSLRAGIGGGCLLHQGVSCRSCTDACEPRALRFDLRSGPVGAVHVEDSCTGCGDCVGMCPVQAITITEPKRVRV